MANMPTQKPGRSEQSVATPEVFLHACRIRLNIGDFSRDLAADDNNAVVPTYFTEQDDALKQVWHDMGGWQWLNPPYSNISPWVAKAVEESQQGAQIAMLVPASTGSNWWAGYVDGNAYITFLNGRITFVGHNAPYPKDLALLLYAPFLKGGSCIWSW